MRIHYTDSEKLFRRLGEETERTYPSFTVEVAVVRVMEITVYRDDLLLQLNDDKVLRENLERKVSKQESMKKAMTVSVKQSEKEMCWLQDETGL